jgi:ATP-dependent Clp protease ATP-binding subunit ClpX
MENLAKILNIPLVIVDANTFTEAGYVGEDVENILNRLLKKANGNIKKAEKGMVYIDEIDKLAKKNFDLDKKDVGGEGVQQALLKMLEGADVYVEQSDGFMNQKTPINTSNILFVLGGAFVGIDEIIKKRDPSLKKSIGFNSINNKEKEKPINLELTHDDLIEFGFIPEFVGRIPVIVTLSHLKEDELKKILTKPKNAILKQYKALFKADGINLKFNDSAIDYIVSEAMKKNIGARGLRSVIEKQMYEIMFDAPQKEIKNLTVTKEMLNIKKKKAKM